MSLDTTIPGDAASVRALAERLSTLKDSVERLDIERADLASRMQYAWAGSAAQAFHDALQALRRSQFPVSDYLGDAVDVLRAYANRLERGRDYFDQILDSAADVGLSVSGLVIESPSTWLTFCPDLDAPYTPPTGSHQTYLVAPGAYRPQADQSPEVNEWYSYTRRLAAFNDASEKVGAWEGELDEWLEVHMAPLAARITELSSVAETFLSLVNGNELVIDASLESWEARTELSLEGFREQQSILSDAAKDAQATARSGNPARRAAYEAFDFADNRVKIGDLEVKIGRIGAVAEIIPIAGDVIDVSMAAYDISHGESESSVAVGLAGGALGSAAGGVAGTALAGSIAAPPVAAGAIVIGLGVGVGFAVTEGAKWLWEAAVSLETRESIDYWLEEHVLWDSTSGTLATR